MASSTLAINLGLLLDKSREAAEEVCEKARFRVIRASIIFSVFRSTS